MTAGRRTRTLDAAIHARTMTSDDASDLDRMDDDGGWHEGLSYWGGYLTKTVWWTEVAHTALGIDSFRKPFFANVGNYPLYTAPPGSPDMGFGDLSFRPPPPWNRTRPFQRSGRAIVKPIA